MVLDLAVFAGLVLLLAWVALPSEKRVRKQGQEFARRNHAFVDGEFVRDFDRASNRANVVFAAAFLTGAAVVLMLRRVVDFDSHLAMLLTGSTAWMSWAAFRLRIAGREFPVPRGRSVTARARRATLSDYLPRAALALSGLSAALSGALALAVAVWWRQGDVGARDAVPIVVGGIVACGFLLVAHLIGRAMCERPQSSVDACHLYFQDALRAEALTRLHTGVCWTASAVGITISSTFKVADLLGPVLPLVFISLMGSFPAFALVARTSSWYRRQLWPTLLPGQVLMPGDAVPPWIGVPA